MEKGARHFEELLSEVSEKVLRLGGLVEEAIGRSILALTERNTDLAAEVIAQDAAVDRLELEIDRLCLEALVRRQPMARDLRFLSTAMKITPDLERIADNAVNVCERVLELSNEPPFPPLIDLPVMGRHAQDMVRRSLNAFVQRDAGAARAVIDMDDELDDHTRLVFRVLLSHMLEDPKLITRAIRLTFVAKYFERVGDQATNICEQVVYMAEGEVIKHLRSDDAAEDSGEA